MCACNAFLRIVSKSCSEIQMLNCLFFRIFPPYLSFPSTKQKPREAGFVWNCGARERSVECPLPQGVTRAADFVTKQWVRASAQFEAFGREPVRRRLAKCDAGFVGTSSISFASARERKLIHSAAPPLKIAIALLDCDFVFCSRRRNVGFSCCGAHTLAAEAENRTQR